MRQVAYYFYYVVDLSYIVCLDDQEIYSDCWEKIFIQKGLEEQLYTSQSHLSKATLEITNFKYGTVGHIARNLAYDINGTTASTATQYSHSIFVHPSSVQKADVCVQLAEEAKIGTVILTTDPSTF